MAAETKNINLGRVKPIRGVDYWTESDKQAIIDDVLASLPTYDGSLAVDTVTVNGTVTQSIIAGGVAVRKIVVKEATA